LFLNLQLYNNLDSCGEYSLRTWAVEKRRIEGVLLTPLRSLQMHRAFIAAFTSEKTMDDSKKKLYSAIGHLY
jgi:hypothetical protein